MFLKAKSSTHGQIKKYGVLKYIGAGCTGSELARQQSFEKVPSSSGQSVGQSVVLLVWFGLVGWLVG